MMPTPIMRLPVRLEQVYLVIDDLTDGLVLLLGLLSPSGMVCACRSYVTVLTDDCGVVRRELL